MRKIPPPTSYTDVPPSGPATASLLAVFGTLLGAASFSTQQIAEQLAYHPALGAPVLSRPESVVPRASLFVTSSAVALYVLWRSPQARPMAPALLGWLIVGASTLESPIYPPFQVLVWSRALSGISGYHELVVSTGGQAGAGLAALLAAVAVLYRSATPSSSEVAAVAHGSARYADTQDLQTADLLSGEGLVLGAVAQRGQLRPITDRSDRHLLIIMPPGGGKTTGPVAGSLLNVSDSALVLDPKGEVWDLTSGWRAAQGHRCIRFAPLEAGSSRWNPLAEIVRGDDEVTTVSTLATNLVAYPAGHHADNHWTASARSLLVCLILHALYTDPQPSMAGVRHKLTVTAHQDLFDALACAAHDPELSHGWTDFETGSPTTTHPEVARLAQAFAETPVRERGSIISTLLRFLEIWGDPRLQESTAWSDWSVDDLLSTDRKTSCYLVFPTSQLTRVGGLVRVLVALLVHKITSRCDTWRDRRLLIVLDEFASLGRIPMLEDVLAFLRGYGVRAVLAVQDLSQLQRLYGANESLTGTCQVHLSAATTSLQTQEAISRRLGDTTVAFNKRSRSGSTWGKMTTTLSRTEVRRPLLTPGEVGALPPDSLIVTMASGPPIRAQKLPFWELPQLRQRAAIAPPTLSAERLHSAASTPEAGVSSAAPASGWGDGNADLQGAP